MKIRKSDYLLAVLWPLYIAFVGPWSLSARDWWLVVGAGIALAGLIYWTIQSVRYYLERDDETP